MNQNQLSNNNAYSSVLPQPYPFKLSNEMTVEHSYIDSDNRAIKIATEFLSDQGVWNYRRRAATPLGPFINEYNTFEVGDFAVENVGSSLKNETLGKILRCETSPFIKEYEEADLPVEHFFELNMSESFPNGIFPEVLYIGNHNLNDATEQLELLAYEDEDYSNLIYKCNFTYDLNVKETFAVNSMPYIKAKYFVVKITSTTHRSLKIGRMVLASTLPTTSLNNMTKEFTWGFRDYKEEIITESKSRIANRKAFVKSFAFSIRVDLNKDKRLVQEIQQLIGKGNGTKPFLVIPDPTDTSWLCLYGVLKDFPVMSHESLFLANFSFEMEEEL